MKKTLLTSVLALSVLSAVVFLTSAKKAKPVGTDLIADIPTVQAFTNETVPQADIEKIVSAGMNAQSAINMQPWHFTVVTNKELLNGISEKMKAGMKKPPKGMDGPDSPKPPAPPAGAPANGAKAGMGDSPVAIIVSAKDGSEYDAGLASELMTIEAVLLGYGTKIISSPTIVLNGSDKEEYKKILGIPADMSAKGVILIGKYDQENADGVTSATLRKDKKEIVTYVK